MNRPEYRHDIQILRGVAVVFVVLFHLDFSFMRSGFLGVDIFFVISGFLMAHLYAGTNLLSFYHKRANRLLPAYFFVVLASIGYAVFAMKYSDLQQVSSQVLFAATFLSNIGFWLSDSYFSQVEFKPLLHLWSLGIEAQFYVVFPFICFVYRKAKYAVFALFLTSLLLCFVVVEVSPKTSFFLLPFRLWEFLAGVYIALLPNSTKLSVTKIRSVGGPFCLILLCSIPIWPVSGVEQSVITGHPGMMAFFVVLLTALLLKCNLPDAMLNSRLGRLFEYIGKYSYSIYLVHFPIIVFFLYKPFQGTRLSYSGMITFFTLIALIAMFTWLSFRFFENAEKYTYGLKVYAPVTLLCVTVGFFAPSLTAVVLTDSELKLQQAIFDRSTFRCGKMFRIMNPWEKVCSLNEPVGLVEGEVLLLGNSHADSIKTALATVAMELNQRVWFTVQNDPLWGTNKSMSPEDVMEVVRQKHIDHIVVHYNSIMHFTEIFGRFVELSKRVGVRVSYIMPVPQWAVSVPQALIEKNPAQLVKLKKDRDAYMRKQSKLYTYLNNIHNHNFMFVDTIDVFCQETCQVVSSDGYPLYFDSQHLTLRGAELLKPILKKVLQLHET